MSATVWSTDHIRLGSASNRATRSWSAVKLHTPADMSRSCRTVMVAPLAMPGTNRSRWVVERQATCVDQTQHGFRDEGFGNTGDPPSGVRGDASAGGGVGHTKLAEPHVRA